MKIFLARKTILSSAKTQRICAEIYGWLLVFVAAVPIVRGRAGSDGSQLLTGWQSAQRAHSNGSRVLRRVVGLVGPLSRPESSRGAPRPSADGADASGPGGSQVGHWRLFVRRVGL